MNALRQIVTPKDGKLSVRLPKEYTQKQFEVIVLPIDEPTEKDPHKLAMAHTIIGRGVAIPHDFISDFEQDRQDRPLPFRDK